MWKIRNKWPYSQQEVGDQISHISHLIDQEKRHPSVIATEAIETAREVLAFMLDENIMKQRSKHGRAV